MKDVNNLLGQTKEILEKHGNTLKDIEWFGSARVRLVGNLKKALDFSYNSGFGIEEVFEDLILVGKDFWLERHEYDGSEWWEYKVIPSKPKKSAKLGLRNLKVVGDIDSISNNKISDTYCLIKNSK